MRRRLLSAPAVLAVLVGLASPRAAAALTVTSDAAAFFAANTQLAEQDFESAQATGAMTGPLTAQTDNGIFAPGDVAELLAISALPSASSDLFVGLSGLGGRIASSVGVNEQGSTLVLSFDGGVEASGISLFSVLGPSNIEVEIFGPTGLLGSATTDQGAAGFPVFIGAVSDTDPIVRIDLTSRGGFVNAYGVAYGSAGVPEPSTGVLVGAGLLLLATRRRHLS